jgi:pseudouridine synthase
VTSRRGAADVVRTGRVLVNGRPPRGPGDPIEPDADRVTVDGRPLSLPRTVWIVLHKPPGLVTSRAGAGRYPTVFGLLRGAPEGVVAVGRLDVLSEGLLLFTTDGEAANRLMHPRWQVERTYRVEVTGRPGRDAREVLARGVDVGDEEPVRPVAWRFHDGRDGGTLEVTLREGRSRVVRRIATVLGLGVRRLVRIAYGPVRLGDLPPGRTRSLTEREVSAVYRALHLDVPGAVVTSPRPVGAAGAAHAARTRRGS